MIQIKSTDPVFLICLFLIPFLSVPLFFIPSLSQSLLSPLYFLILFLLVGFHTWGSLAYVFFSKNEQDRISRLKPQIFKNIRWISALMLASALLLIMLHVCEMYQWRNLLISFFALVYLIWNTYHFVAQQQGILRILKRGCQQTRIDRLFDTVYCYGLMVVGPFFVWVVIGYRMSSLNIIEGLRESLTLLSRDLLHGGGDWYYFGFATVTAAYLFWRRFKMVVVAQYLSIFIQSLGIYLIPPFFTYVVYMSTHWLQESFLVWRYAKNDTPEFIKFFPIIAIGLSVVFYLVYFQMIPASRLTAFGDVKDFTGVGKIEFAFFAILNIFLMTLNFLHFYLDRYIHRQKIQILA